MRKKFITFKRIAALGMASILTASMAACGEGEKEETTTQEVQETPDIEFASASYSEKKGVIIRVKTAFEGEATEVFTIRDEDGNEVAIKDATVVMNTNVTFTLAEALDLMKTYTITYGNVTVDIRMPSPYSKEEFETAYTYDGDDLGASYSSNETVFKVWAPTANAVSVNLYESGTDGTDDLIESIEMKSDINGTWVAEKSGDLNGVYYTYTVDIKGEKTEACDPYARATGVNGKRAMVIDLEATNPEGWDEDKNPNASLNITDAIIYELHLRDISSDESSGITNVGKYLGLTETGTTNNDGDCTGLDYIKDLGVNYVHIMPMYDYGSVDEAKLDTPQFNWGYDPVNYNVPEGSYSTDPYNGEVRVKEAKEMVKALHDNGISVIMDVVYNHVYNAEEFCFNNIVPEYFSRVSDAGDYSNGSGCGNDVASERSMVRKYIVDSVKYWADEYHIDGFRFDLVGLIDTDTINQVIEEVHETNPDVIFYGEGWDMKTTLTKSSITLTTQGNSSLVPEFAFFNDYFRDNLRGGNGGTGKGYATGAVSNSAAVKNMLKGTVSFTREPSKTVNYSGCHDNNTLFDKISISCEGATMEEKAAMNKLTAAITLTSQGVPFLMAGEELLRSKVNEDGSFNENSYNAPDAVNSIKWSVLSDSLYKDVHDYYKGLIEFRKTHSGLRMMTSEEVNDNLTIMDNTPENVVAYSIKGGANGESSQGIFVIYNGTNETATVTLPDGNWNIYVNDKTAGNINLGTVSGTVDVTKVSAMVLVKE